METFLAPNTVGQIFQGVTAVIVAVIAYVVGPVIAKRLRRNRKPAASSRPRGLLYALVAGVSATVTFLIVGVSFNALAPKPSVAITNPAAGQQIEMTTLPSTGSGSFMVSGISTEVFANPSLRVYVLVHPAEPFASGWWIQQPATVDRNGQWTMQAWYGAHAFPPQPGNRIDLMAIVSTPVLVAGRVQISDPKDIEPVAQSDIIGVSIGSTQ